jgi:hypothetical protein
MTVLAFSIITNKIVTEFDSEDSVEHTDVVKIAFSKALETEKLVSRFFNVIFNNSCLLDE